MPYEETTKHICQNQKEKRIYKNMWAINFKVYLKSHVS